MTRTAILVTSLSLLLTCAAKRTEVEVYTRDPILRRAAQEATRILNSGRCRALFQAKFGLLPEVLPDQEVTVTTGYILAAAPEEWGEAEDTALVLVLDPMIEGANICFDDKIYIQQHWADMYFQQGLYRDLAIVIGHEFFHEGQCYLDKAMTYQEKEDAARAFESECFPYEREVGHVIVVPIE